MGETELQELEELKKIEENPILLQNSGTRAEIESLAHEGESAFIRNRARGLLNAVPCPSCLDE